MAAPDRLPRPAAPLAVTMGEPAGIGGEIALKAWAARRARALPPFFLLDDPERLRPLARALALDVPLREIAAPDEALAVFDRALPVLPQILAAPVAPGRPDPANAPAVLAAITHAVELAAAGEAAGLVTNPIHKHTLYAAGFLHPGHTEYLAALTRAAEPPVMMLACPGLRVVPATIHLPLAKVPAALERAALVRLGTTLAAALRADFGIPAPRLAFAGLNPHAGEGGALGREEIETIAPAIADLRAQGIDARGPSPADSLFHPAARAGFDAAICMYHDQALIPLKTIDFAGGVNVTLGLPILRTSPDHGTAFDIAGTGRADPSSLIAALALAGEIAARRQASRPKTGRNGG